MTSKEDIIRMAREAGFVSAEYWPDDFKGLASCVERFAALVRADEREQVAAWMMQRGYATGHGDTTKELLKELEWQVRADERETCAKVCDELDKADETFYRELSDASVCAATIRARGQA